MNEKRKVIIVAFITGVLAFVFATLLILVLFDKIVPREAIPEETTVGEVLPSEPSVEFASAPSNDNISFESTTSGEVVVTVYVPVSDEHNNEENEANNNTGIILRDNSFYVVSSTPDSAGLVMRSAASAASEKLGILPEGSRVYVYSDDPSNKTGYVRVLATQGNSDIHCYVLKQYLTFESEFTNNDNSEGTHIRYVSFNTPGHEGVNLRSDPSSSSEKICTINEGEQVRIVSGAASQKGYVQVVYDHPHAGELFQGWVLEEYLVK